MLPNPSIGGRLNGNATAPSIAAHADVYVNATGASAANVTYASPTWTDAVDGSGTTAKSLL